MNHHIRFPLLSFSCAYISLMLLPTYEFADERVSDLVGSLLEAVHFNPVHIIHESGGK